MFPVIVIIFIFYFTGYSESFLIQKCNIIHKINDYSKIRVISTIKLKYKIFESKRINTNIYLINTEDKIDIKNENDLQLIDDDKNDLNIRIKKEGKIRALWNEYGIFYFQVWFCTYLPFLLSFFYIIENDLLKQTQFNAFDPKKVVVGMCDFIEKYSGNFELTVSIRDNTHVTNFATAYLLADLVPTTFIALGIVTYIIKQKEKKNKILVEAENINKDEGI